MAKVPKAQWLYIGKKIDNKVRLLKSNMSQLKNNNLTKELKMDLPSGNFINKKWSQNRTKKRKKQCRMWELMNRKQKKRKIMSMRRNKKRVDQLTYLGSNQNSF